MNEETKPEFYPTVNKMKLFKGNNPDYVLWTLFVCLSPALGSIIFLKGFSVVLLTSVQLAAFSISGIFYTMSLNNYPSQGEIIVKTKWWYTLLLFLLTFVGLSLLYFFINKSVSLLSVASSSAFLLPFLAGESRIFYLNITASGKVSNNTGMYEDNVVPNRSDLQNETINRHPGEASSQHPRIIERITDHNQAKPGQIEKEAYEQKHMLEKEAMREQKKIYEGKLYNEFKLLSEKEKKSHIADLKAAEEKIKSQQREIYENKLKLTLEEVRHVEKEIYESKLNVAMQEFRKEKDMYNQVIEEKSKLLHDQKNEYDIKLTNALGEIEKLKNDLKKIFEREKIITTQQEEYKHKLELSLEENQKMRSSHANQLLEQQNKIIENQQEIYQKKLLDEKEKIRNEYEAREKKLVIAQELNLQTQKQTYESKIAGETKIIKQEKAMYERELAQQRDVDLQNNKKLYDNKLVQVMQESLNQKERYEQMLKEATQKITQAEKEAYESKLNETVAALNTMHKVSIEKLNAKNLSSGLNKDSLKTIEGNREQRAFIKNDVPETAMENEPGDILVKKENIGKNERTWLYTNPEVDQKPVVFLNSVRLYVQLSVNIGEPEKIFPISTSLEISLSEFFNHFINLKTKKLGIDLFDSNDNPYHWKFYTKGVMRLGNKELDPSISLQKNKIKELSIIFATRIL